METYLISVIEDLVVAAIICGVVYAYARSRWEKFGTRVITIAMIAGLAAGAVMAWFKQNTSFIATRTWNFYIFSITIGIFLVTIILLIVAGALAKKSKKKAAGQEGGEAEESSVVHTLRLCVLYGFAAIVFLQVFYSVPDVYNYPANFGVDTILSSDFAVRIVGWLGGMLVVWLIFLSLQKAYQALNSRQIAAAAIVIVAVNCFVQLMKLGQLMITLRIITRGTAFYQIAFALTGWVNNHSALFTLLIMLMALALGIVIVVLSLQDKEPYSNPAEHRRNKARWRNRRRWVICLIICLVFSFFTITAWKSYTERGPEIVASEECLIDDEGMHISLDQVNDGHLHRFTFTTTAGFTTSTGYETKGGIGVRVIVIKKPNSNAYGIGLDACDICGTTGYYERDGQVVCSRCDVVMNINTIGFKGGCNPIVIDYSIEDGYINIPASALLEYEKIPGSSW